MNYWHTCSMFFLIAFQGKKFESKRLLKEQTFNLFATHFVYNMNYKKFPVFC